MKIINYSLFVASSSVKNYLFSKGVDPDTVYLNDYKFMKKIFKIMVNIFPTAAVTFLLRNGTQIFENCDYFNFLIYRLTSLVIDPQSPLNSSLSMALQSKKCLSVVMLSTLSKRLLEI